MATEDELRQQSEDAAAAADAQHNADEAEGDAGEAQAEADRAAEKVQQ